MTTWWDDHEHQPWLRVRLGYWRELREWPRPGCVFQWSGILPEFWYYVKCACWHRYNVLRIPTLPPTWNEWDDKLLHAAMAVFADYMRRDSPGRWSVAALRKDIDDPTVDADGRAWCEGYLPVATEMEAIYRWWTIDRARERQEEHDALMTWHEVFQAAGGLSSEPSEHPHLNRLVFAESAEADALHAKHGEIEARNEARDEEMLIRLMKIRQHLWT